MVIPGDQLICVNGVYGGAGVIQAAMKGATALDIAFRRVVKFCISLDKKGCLGMRLRDADMSVLSVLNGSINAYNAAQPFLVKQVNVGDTITEVNGKAGTPGELMLA